MKLSTIDSNNLTADLIKQLFFNVEKEDYEYADYLIIYGCHMKELLDERLKHALKIIQAGKVGKIVLTGGVGVNGDFNESEYMLNYLINNNIERDKIIIENKSTTTEENNINVMNILNLKSVTSPVSIVLVTHQVHLLRLIMHWSKVLNNSNIHFYYDYVEETSASYDNAINNPIFKDLLKNQVDKIKKYINDGIYDDLDISNND